MRNSSYAAVRSLSKAGRSDAVRQVRAAFRSELGVLVAAFVVLRVIAAANSPTAFPDTHSYLRLSFIGQAPRLWTVPVIWNLFVTDELRVAFQLLLGIFAWSALAISLAARITGKWLKWLAAAATLALGLVPQLTGYDATLLSESISSSLLVLLVALLIRAEQVPRRGLGLACLGVTTLWVFTRQVNVLVFVALLPIVCFFLLRRGAQRQRIALVAALGVIGAWGMFAAIAQPGDGPIWKQNALEILENRIASDPAALRFFQARGLPSSPVILQERGAFPGATSPLFNDPAMRQWLNHRFKTVYLSYLLSDWRHTLGEPFVRMPSAISSQVTAGPARPVLPEPLAQLLWGTRQGDIVFWAAVAAVLTILAIGAGSVIPFMPVTWLLLLASAFGAILVWNLTGNLPGDASLGRQFLPVAIMLRLGLLLMIVSSADALRRRLAPVAPAAPDQLPGARTDGKEDPGVRSSSRIEAGVRPALVSVVLPVRNGEAHIETQLSALAEQTYSQPWELVVVNNGCKDSTMKIVERWRDRVPDLIVVSCERRGLNRARAAGLEAARGDFVAYCDADDVVTPGWLAALADAAPHAHLVGGRTEFRALNDELRRAWNGGPPPVMTELNSAGYGFLPYVPGGNCGVWSDVARSVGWDESFRFGASDIDFAWRAQLAGFSATFEPRAVVRVRFRTRLPDLVRQWFRYGASEPRLFRRFGRLGMPRRGIIESGKTWIWLVVRLPGAVRSRAAMGNWLRMAARSAGRMWGSLRWLVVYL